MCYSKNNCDLLLKSVDFPADIKMSGDVADSTDSRSTLSLVETGKGLLFRGMEQESTGGREVLGLFK